MHAILKMLRTRTAHIYGIVMSRKQRTRGPALLLHQALAPLSASQLPGNPSADPIIDSYAGKLSLCTLYDRELSSTRHVDAGDTGCWILCV